MLWNRVTGQPLYNVLTWQDTRTEAALAPLAADAEIARGVHERTGLKIDSYFSVSKIRWLLDHCREDLPLENIACGTLDTWMIWKLTDGQSFVTDVSTASRTLLFNIHTLQWDDWLLDLFNIPRDVLPDVLETAAHFGDVTCAEAACQGVPIVTSLVDQPAAMVGQGCLRSGEIKATYGTGCFINLNTGQQFVDSQRGLLTMLAWQRGQTPTYGLDGGVFTAAASINWLRDGIGLLHPTEDIDRLCADMPDSNGVLWLPAQAGLGAPYWNRHSRGAWLGLELATTKAQLVRAVLEGIAGRVTQIVQAMQADAGISISRLRVDGGLSHSETLMQIQADLLGCPVEALTDAQATARGVCFLVARTVSLWQSDTPILEHIQIGRTYEPMLAADIRAAWLQRFDHALKHLKAWHTHE